MEVSELHRLMLASAFLLGTMPELASGQERPFSGTVGISSDYAFRGISQTLGDPALQISTDLELPAGFYAWAWSSNVDFIPDSEADDGATLEIDLAVGFAQDISDVIGIEVELIRYVFPGTIAGVEYDYNELMATVRYDGRYHATVAFSDDVDGTGKPSRFYSIGGKIDLWCGTSFSLEYGLFDLNDAYGYAYTYTEASLARQFGNKVVALGHIFTYGAANKIYGDRVTGSRFVLSLQLNW